MTAPDSPSVTIIVAGFDVAPYAPEALRSLEEQTFSDWVAILVDDASGDGTDVIFSEAAARDPRFRLVRHDRRLGLSSARNTGLGQVGTPLVGFLDADDRLRPTALERLVGTITSSGSDVVVGAYVRLRPDDLGGYRPGPVQPWVAASTDPARTAVTLDDHPAVTGNIVAWSKVSRIDLWRRTGLSFPVGRSYEDQVVTQLLYTRARGIDVVPDVVVEWRERADGTSITQRTSEPSVLRDYLEGLSGGLAVLDAAGHRDAAAARVRLILAMDVPPLIEIARTHPDDDYRRMLGAFVRELSSRPGGEPAPSLAAAALW